MMLRPTGRAFVTLFYVLVAAAAVAQQTSAPEPAPGTIIGTVLDTNGGEIPGADITLQDASGSAVQHVAAQDNGSFQFSGVKPLMPFRVSVAAQGFAAWRSNDIVLQPGQFFILTGIGLRLTTVQVTVTAVTPEQLAVQQVHDEEKQRIAGVIPNFYVEYEHSAPPLSPKLKFQLASRALVDPVTLAGFGLGAAFYQAGRYPGYGEGFVGYGQRLGSTFAGGYTNVLVGNAILPSLLHQDPRYFYQGTGTTRSRLLHALSTPFVTRGDNGHTEINFSNIGGDLASGAIANAYYPENERGGQLVVRSALIGTAGRLTNAVIQEFLLPKLTSRRDREAR